MTISDINLYLTKNNISITQSEIIIIYNFIKKNCKFILNGDENCFNDLKEQLSESTYNKAMELYEKYKKNIQKLN